MVFEIFIFSGISIFIWSVVWPFYRKSIWGTGRIDPRPARIANAVIVAFTLILLNWVVYIGCFFGFGLGLRNDDPDPPGNSHTLFVGDFNSESLKRVDPMMMAMKTLVHEFDIDPSASHVEVYWTEAGRPKLAKSIQLDFVSVYRGSGGGNLAFCKASGSDKVCNERAEFSLDDVRAAVGTSSHGEAVLARLLKEGDDPATNM